MRSATSPSFLLPAFVLACSSSTPAGTAGAVDAGADTAIGQPECTAQSACGAAPGGADAGSWACVKTVDATVLDTSRDPVASFVATMCGANLCEFATSDAAGHLHFAACEAMDRPAFKVEGGAAYVSFAVPVTSEVDVVPPAVLVPLPSTGVAFQMGTAQSLASSEVTLAVTAATTVTLDPLLPDDEKQFKAAQVPLADAPPSLDASLNLEVLFGLAPLNTLFAPAATLTVPNAAAWPAGAEVELFLHGVDLSTGALAPYGGWAPMGTGHVSADGKSVTTDPGPGNGIGELSLIGARRKG